MLIALPNPKTNSSANTERSRRVTRLHWNILQNADADRTVPPLVTVPNCEREYKQQSAQREREKGRGREGPSNNISFLKTTLHDLGEKKEGDITSLCWLERAVNYPAFHVKLTVFCSRYAAFPFPHYRFAHIVFLLPPPLSSFVLLVSREARGTGSPVTCQTWLRQTGSSSNSFIVLW